MDDYEDDEILPPRAIDGQIDIGELFVHEEEKLKDEDEREQIEVADGQMSLLDGLSLGQDENQNLIQKDEENLKAKDGKDKTLKSLLTKIGGEPSKVVKKQTTSVKKEEKTAEKTTKPAKKDEKVTKKSEKVAGKVKKDEKVAKTVAKPAKRR